MNQTWTKRLAQLVLPIGIVFLGLVLLRALRLLAAAEPLDPADVVGVVIPALIAAYLIWSGWQYRRSGFRPH